MDIFSFIQIGLLIIIGIFSFLSWKKPSSVSEQNTDETLRQIQTKLDEHQYKLKADIGEQINAKSLEQTERMNTKMVDLERRFGQLQESVGGKISEELQKIQMLQSQQIHENKQKFDLQQNEQKIQFQQMKTENQEGLVKIQTLLQERLAQAIGLLNSENKRNFDALNEQNRDRLAEIRGEIEKRLNENLAQNLKSFEDVTKNLAQMQGTAQRMIDSTSSIDKLNSIFERTSSKAFGNFAENYLETLLGEHLADGSWSSQVTVPGSSEKIDFVIYLAEKKIGIDSKFPVTKYQDFIDAPIDAKKIALKNYLQAVINMAGDISTKYSKPGFVETLLLYMPSDSMYSEVVNDVRTMEILAKLKVTPTSPATIFPLIMLIQTYQYRMNVNENAERIIKGLTIVKKNIGSFREEFRKLGDKIRQAQDNYDKADRNLVVVQREVFELEATGGNNTISEGGVTENQAVELI